jgi:hypothetical protein
MNQEVKSQQPISDPPLRFSANQRPATEITSGFINVAKIVKAAPSNVLSLWKKIFE